MIDYLEDMKFIQACLTVRQGQDRLQTSLFPVSLDASIDKDNDIRLIDAFVDGLNMSDLDFDTDFADNGRPAKYKFNCNNVSETDSNNLPYNQEDLPSKFIVLI